MGRHLRFGAVLIVVVLALTGFSTGSSSGKSGSKSKSRSSSSSGGGCSSSKKSNDTSHGSGYRGGYRDTHQDDTSSSSSGGSSSSTTTDQVTVTVVDCAGPGRTKRAKADTTAALRVTSHSTADDLSVSLALHFENAAGSTLDSPTTKLRVAPGETRTVTVRMTDPRKAAQVRDCEVDRVTAVTV